MRGTALVRDALAAVILSLSTASLVAAAPPVYAQHRYVVLNVYRVYNTPGANQSTGHGCSGPCSPGITTTYSWSNSWSATITFSKPPIDAAVGWDSSQSGSVAYSNTFTVPARKTGVIWFVDNYHVKLMNVRHDTCYPYAGCTSEYGTAESRQWYERIYYVVLR